MSHIVLTHVYTNVMLWTRVVIVKTRLKFKSVCPPSLLENNFVENSRIVLIIFKAKTKMQNSGGIVVILVTLAALAQCNVHSFGSKNLCLFFFSLTILSYPN